jgi:hypothetical protein
MRVLKLSSSADRVTSGFIAVVQLLLAGFFAWQPLMYVSIFMRTDFQPQAVPQLLLMLLCTAVVVAFSILFAAKVFRSSEVRNLARVMAVVNSFVLFLFGMFLLINSGSDHIAGFFFFLFMMISLFVPLAVVVAVLCTIGCISLLLSSKKSSTKSA